MSFEPDNTDNELSELALLQAILTELKRISLMLGEVTELRIKDEDLNGD